MKTKKVSFVFKKKKFNVTAEKCGPIKKVVGLMFSRREKAKALLFEFDNPTKMKIHSLFVFFPFISVWLNNEDKVVGIKKVKPFTLSVSLNKSYKKLLEIPINKKYSSHMKFFVGD